MTYSELKASEMDCVTAKDIAPILNCDPYKIVLQAKQDKADGINSLGFNVIVCGTRVKIPRRAFIAFMEGAAAERSK